MKTKASYFASLICAILFQIFLIPAADAANKIMPVDMQNGAGINYERWDMGGDMWDDIHPFETGYAKDYNDLITLQKTGSAIALFFLGGGMSAIISYHCKLIF